MAKSQTLLLTVLLASAALAGCTGGNDTDPTPGGGTTSPTAGGVTPSTTPSSTPGVPTPPVSIPTPPVSGTNDPYGLTTGGATGVYYAIGNGIANAVRNTTAAGFTITDVATSQGSVQNMQRLRNDDHQLALTQNDVLFEAYNGEGRFAGDAVTNLRAVASLYSEMIQIVTLRDANIMSVDDLAGKNVVIGAAGSGAAINAGDIINASGVDMEEQFLDLATGLERLKDGSVDAVFWTGGIPTGAITSLGTTHPVRIVPISEEMKADLLAEKPFYANATLPANTYPGQSEAVETVAVRAVLVARDDVPADDIAKLLEIIFDGTTVQNSHAQGQNIKTADAFLGVTGVPWHDGARYYFLTKGMTVPS